MSESEVVHAERCEQITLRDVEDAGWTKRVGGVRYYVEDLPDRGEIA